MMRRLCLVLTCLMLAAPLAAQAQGPLRIEITNGVIEPVPMALPSFVAENGRAADFATEITNVIASDLTGSGLFRIVDQAAYISQVKDFNAPVAYADWKAINAQGLVTGAVSISAQGRLSVKFRLFDVFRQAEMGTGLQFGGDQADWRRIAHKVADAVYSRITGESGYFDSRVVFVSETGPKGNRQRRLAIMDYDGANAQYLTDPTSIVLAPRISPQGDRVLYTSYETGYPRIYMLDLGTLRRQRLEEKEGTMSFSPRFSPDGETVLFSLTTGGNTDLYSLDLRTGQRTRLTSDPSIETSPSYSPDGRQIVFESDRSGLPQLYIMDARGGDAKRISFGQGKYGTPVWSPRGDLIAFTKQVGGRFHIGVMRTDGSGERLLTASFLDEGPTWSPNGRVIMFTRETSGVNGAPSIYSVDISGRNLRRVPTPGEASAPDWSRLLQ